MLRGRLHGGRLPERDGGAGGAAALRCPQPGHLRAGTGLRVCRRVQNRLDLTSELMRDGSFSSSDIADTKTKKASTNDALKDNTQLAVFKNHSDLSI